MSRAKSIALILPLMSAALVSACASSGETKKSATETAIEQAMAEELAPATPEEIEAAMRADPLTRANFWSKEFRKDPTNEEVTIAFMNALRGIGSHTRAIEVGSKALPLHPTSVEMHIAMARALMNEGRPAEAADIYSRAVRLAPDNATVHAGLGLAFDQIELHGDAQAAYRTALGLEPDRVSTLTNYGLSLALTGNLTAAEARLREAALLPDADARVRQNLALILGLQGKFAEARQIDPHAPERAVNENLGTLKSMLSPVRDYGALRDEADDEAYGDPEPRQEEASRPPALRGSLGGK